MPMKLSRQELSKREIRVQPAPEDLNDETLATELKVDQETMKPGKMQGRDAKAGKPGKEFSWLHGFRVKKRRRPPYNLSGSNGVAGTAALAFPSNKPRSAA